MADTDSNVPTVALSRDTVAQVAGVIPTARGVKARPSWAPSAFGAGQSTPTRDDWYADPAPAPATITPASPTPATTTVPGERPAAPAPAPRSSAAPGSGGLVADAQQVERDTGIPASVLLAIPVNESGNKWGPGSAPYGIKGKNPSTGASLTAPTWEDYGQGRVNITDTFRAYNSPLEAMYDFASFVKSNPRYAPALQRLQRTGDASAFVHDLNRAGYATDPVWGDKITNIMGRQSGGASVIAPTVSGSDRSTQPSTTVVTPQRAQPSTTAMAPTQQAASTSAGETLSAPAQPQVAPTKHHFTYVDNGQEVLKIIREDGGQEFHVLGKQSPHPNGTVVDPGNLPVGAPLPEDVAAAMPQWEKAMYPSEGAGEGVGQGQDEPPTRDDWQYDPGVNLSPSQQNAQNLATIQEIKEYTPPPPNPLATIQDVKEAAVPVAGPPEVPQTSDITTPPTLTPQEVVGGFQRVGAQLPQPVLGRAASQFRQQQTPASAAATAPQTRPAAPSDTVIGQTQAVTGTPSASLPDIVMGAAAIPQRMALGAIPAPSGSWADTGQPSATADFAGGITNVAPTPEQWSLDPRVTVPRAIEREKKDPAKAMVEEFALDPVNLAGGVVSGVVAGARAASWAHRAETAVRAQEVVPGITRVMKPEEYRAVVALRGGRVPPMALGAGTGPLATGIPRVVVPDLDAIQLAASRDPVARMVRSVTSRFPRSATREITLNPAVAAAHPEGARMIEQDINAAARLREGRPSPGEQVQSLHPGGWTQRVVDERLRTPFTDRLASLETQDTYIHLRDLSIQQALGFSVLPESAEGYRMARQLTGSIGKAQAWAEEQAAPILKNYSIHAGDEARSFEAFMRAYEYVQRTNTTDVLDATGRLLKAGRAVPIPSGPAVGVEQRRAIEMLNTILDDAEAKFGARSVRPIPPATLGPGLQLTAAPASVRARFFAAHQALSESLVPTLREAEREGLLRANAVNDMLRSHPTYTHIQTLGEHFQGWGRGEALPRMLPTSPIVRHEVGSTRLSDVSLDGLFARQTSLIQAIERQKIGNALEQWRAMDPLGFGQVMRPLSGPEMLSYHRGQLNLKPGTQLIPRFDNGRLQMYEVPDILGDALMGMNREQAGWLAQGVGRFTRAFTGLVTAYSPNFVVNNFLRHEMAAHHNLQAITGLEFSRLKVLGLPTVPMPTENRLLLENMVSSFWDSLTSGEKGQALVSLLQKQRMPTLGERAAMAAANPRRQMRQLGSEIYMKGYAHSSDVAHARDFESYLAKDETPVQKMGRALMNVAQPWKAIRAAAEVTEMSTRVNVFKAALAAGKSPAEAAYLGRSVTIDYAKGGSAIKALNSLLPFVNSRVQAIGRPLEAFDKNPVKFAVQQAFSTVMPWAITYALNRSPQWSDMYDRISRWEKQNYFVIPVGTFTLPNGQQNMLRINIRKDEASMLTTNLMEYMADQMFHTSYAGQPLDPSQRDERSPYQMWLQELRMTVPIPENPSESKMGWGGLLYSTAFDFPLFNIGEQLKTGTDDFGQPVVPPNQQSLPPEFQYGQTYHPSSAVLAEQLGTLSQGKWQPSPAGVSWLSGSIPLGQAAQGMGDALVERLGIQPMNTPPPKPGTQPLTWDQLEALQKQKALEDTRPWWAKLLPSIVKSSGGAQTLTAKIQDTLPEVRTKLEQSQLAANEYSDWRMQTYYPQRQAVLDNAGLTGQQKRDQLSRLSQQRGQAYDDAYRHYPQAVKDWKDRQALIQQIPGVPVSVASIASAADLDPQFSAQIPKAAADYMLIQTTFGGQLPPAEVQKRQAQVVQNYAQAWGVDPEVARDAIKAQLNQLQMPVAGVPNAAVDEWVNRYLNPQNEIDYHELDSSGKPTGSDDPVLLRRAQAREVERLSAESGLGQDTIRQRISLRLSSPEEQTPEALSLTRAQDLVSRVHDPSQFPAFLDPITHKPLARADGSPSTPDDWQHWGEQIGAAEAGKPTPRAPLPESVRGLVAAQAEGKRHMLKQGLWKDPQAYLDYMRWYGYGKNLTDQEWADYLNGKQPRYKDVSSANIAESTRRDMVIAEAKVTPTARNKMLTTDQWNALSEAERNRRALLGAEARRYTKQAVPKWQDALKVDEVTPGKDASGAFDQLASDTNP